MARFRCMNSDNLLTPPTETGSGVQAPLIVDASYADCASPDGDLIDIVISRERAPAENYQIDYYEVAIETAGGAVTIERLYFGPALEAQRRIQVTPSKKHRLRVRSVQRLRNQFRFAPLVLGVPYHTPVVGETITETNGVTSTVTHVYDSVWCVVSGFSGALPDRDTDANVVITADGQDVYKLTPNHVPTELSGYRVETRSEWSPPFVVSPTSGTPTVTIEASKLTCLQGESVKFESEVSGFQTLYDLHKLHYKWEVTSAGEDGVYKSLQSAGHYWEDEYGVGRNKRDDGYTRSWALAPQTVGSVTVRCTVTDRAGNSAFDEVTITSVAPMDEAGGGFADADIYVCSTSNGGSPRAVPGDTGIPAGNFYTDFDSLFAALPSTGEALILLDTSGTHNATAGNQYNFTGKVPDRLAVMPYNGTGVGVAAGGRAAIDFAFKSEALVQIYQGLSALGAFDSTDPYTPERPQEFIQNAETTGQYQISVYDCWAAGWTKMYVPPNEFTGYFVLNDFEIYDWLDFGIHGGDPCPHVLVGVAAYHNPQAWRYPGKTENAYPASEGLFIDHPGYRSSRPKGARSFCKCYFATYTTHSGSGTGQSQPAARLFGNGGADFPYPGHYVECAFECITSIAVSCTANGGDRNFNAPGSNCFDKCVFHALGGFGPLGVSIAPASLINCKFTMNRSTGAYEDSSQFVTLNANAGAASIPSQNDLENQPIWMEFCTGYDTRADAETARTNISLWASGTVPNNNVTVANNLIYVPNLTTQVTSEGPVATVARYTPPYNGEYNWNDTLGTPGPGGTRLSENLDPANGSIDTSLAATDVLSYKLTPQVGSPAYQSATGDPPVDDLYSVARPSGTASRGAVEPA